MYVCEKRICFTIVGHWDLVDRSRRRSPPLPLPPFEQMTDIERGVSRDALTSTEPNNDICLFECIYLVSCL